MRLGLILAAATLLACGGGSGATPEEPAATPAGPTPAPAEDGAQHAQPQLVGTEWVAIAIEGFPAADGVRSTINFDDEGRAFGEAGCNSFQGGYELDGDRLAFGPLASTRMFCEGPRQEQEDRYLAALARIVRFAIADGELRLFPDGGEPTRFVPADPAAAPIGE
jgi:heat shock protein HslJ